MKDGDTYCFGGVTSGMVQTVLVYNAALFAWRSSGSRHCEDGRDGAHPAEGRGHDRSPRLFAPETFFMLRSQPFACGELRIGKLSAYGPTQNALLKGSVAPLDKIRYSNSR